LPPYAEERNIGPKYRAKIQGQNTRPKYKAKISGRIWGQNTGPKYRDITEKEKRYTTGPYGV